MKWELRKMGTIPEDEPQPWQNYVYGFMVLAVIIMAIYIVIQII